MPGRVRDPAVREKEIKNMSAVYQSLKKEILPELRRARFIANVEFTNYSNEELLALINDNIDILDEEALLRAASVVKDNSAKVEVYKKAIEKFGSDRAKYNLGVAYICSNDLANAKAALKNAPQDADWQNAMGVIALREGKALLFKIYAGIDVFDIEVNEKDPDKFVEAVKAIAPTFGGINLGDIKAPECFEIERRLKEELDIPVMHDDQHGTAIISSAGLLNALEVAGKKIGDVKIVVNGAGASAISCTSLYVALGARKENIIMLDSKGVITSDRSGLTEQKKLFATDRRDVHTLAEAIKGADVFLGLSRGNVLTKDMVRSMAKCPIVFSLANPVPEISYEDAKASRDDILISTGRSDYPNQINNVIGFPYIFRGALDVNASAINEEMKLAAVHAIAALAKKPVPDIVNEAYKVNNFTFGPDYFIPKPVDPRLITDVSIAVAKAAMASGVARKEITDWDA